MRTCPICQDSFEKIILCKTNLTYGTEFDLVECGNCSVIYFEPMPTIEQLAKFYSATYYNFDRWREEGKGKAFSKRLARWKEKGKFLDVGCATGFFINGIKNNSQWEVYGTDFGESAVKFAQEELGLNVFNGDLADADFPDDFFDYVHVNNVLEHVLNPLSLLSEVKRIIKPDGKFFLSVPNGFNDSLDLINFYKEENKPAQSKNGHIFFFQAKTLLMLLDQFGFDIEKKETYSLKRGMRSIGYLPQKKNWKQDYYPKNQPEIVAAENVVKIDDRKKHSDFYYEFRFLQGNLQHISGLYDFGLDFLFILHPKKK